MTELAPQLDALFAAASADLAHLRQAVARYGVTAAPELTLVRGHEYRYLPETRSIEVLIPDLSEPMGRFFLLYLQDLLSCPTPEELLALLSLLQGFGVAHEFAHHLRHQYGQFQADDLWQEEQWANYCAAAFVKSRVVPDRRRYALQLLQRTLVNLSCAEHPLTHLADTFRDPLRAMQIQGDVSASVVSRLEGTARRHDLDVVGLAARSVTLPDGLRARLANRPNLITAYNTPAGTTLVTPMFYTLGWIYLELAGTERQTIGRFVREALGVTSTAPSARSTCAGSNVTPRSVIIRMHERCATKHTFSPARIRRTRVLCG